MREGEATTDRIASRQKSVLDRTHDWDITVYLDKKLVFPNQSETRCSTIIQAVKEVGLWEENCEEAQERKSLKYADLMADCKDKGLGVWLYFL